MRRRHILGGLLLALVVAPLAAAAAPPAPAKAEQRAERQERLPQSRTAVTEAEQRLRELLEQVQAGSPGPPRMNGGRAPA